jgi:lysophospholipid acyltransferase (LPLAT)-like uncharacterized protein
MNPKQANTRPGPLVGGPDPMEHRSRRRMKWWRTALHAIGAPIAVALIKGLWATYRFSVRGEEEVERLVAEGRPLILSCWHDSLFVVAWYTVRLGRLGARVTYLVSPSRDGEFAVRVLGVVGAHVVRGSATRSGVKALHGLYRAIVRDSASPVVLPDGPQGPPHYCKPGSVLLAKLSGAHILPMGCAASRAWRLRTWDRLFIPLPFARVAVDLGTGYTVPSELGDDEQESQRQKLEQVLEELVEAARHRLGRGGEIHDSHATLK